MSRDWIIDSVFSMAFVLGLGLMNRDSVDDAGVDVANARGGGKWKASCLLQ